VFGQMLPAATSTSQSTDQKECGPQGLVFARKDAFGDYRGDASCVE
jgi:hypothetical protein